ncbi:BTB/POZ domain-containing protein At3g56230-like isoform X2 [Nymphaea colorata]|nr:BTB/POZ domain-containing protein At3g56230-like isoform X2 [Nymphaea colorata]XP_049936165.1 BTB/POZ domain-containing protein At3g56230-like isoform X2 [Nymphaea colorata]
MDCCLCSSVAGVFRLPRNSICSSCYEGARSMIAFMEKMDGEPNPISADEQQKSRKIDITEELRSKGLSYAYRKLMEWKERDQGLIERVSFLGGLVDAFKEGLHADVQIKATDGPARLAHRAVLAARSPIFKAMFEADECKASSPYTITLPELKSEELDCLLEFLYSGSLPKDQLANHAHALLIAADKYEVQYLARCCEAQILQTLSTSNALEILELSSLCMNERLKSMSMKTIVKHREEIVFSEGYCGFVMRNAFLAVELTRAMFMEVNGQQDSLKA